MAFLKITFLTLCLMGLGLSARVNIEDMDYNSLISLLSEYDGENVEVEPVINNISQESNFPKYEIETGEEKKLGLGVSQEFSIAKPSATTLLAPQVEVLSLIETFLKLKGEMASKLNALINDNFDVIKSVYNLVISKISKLHSFTLIGISIIRKIFEFSLQMLASWEVNKPSVSFGFDKLFTKY